MFNEVFEEVMTEMGITEWYVLFDSDGFDKVERRIAERYGVEDATEVDGFTEWVSEMAMDL